MAPPSYANQPPSESDGPDTDLLFHPYSTMIREIHNSYSRLKPLLHPKCLEKEYVPKKAMKAMKARKAMKAMKTMKAMKVMKAKQDMKATKTMKAMKVMKVKKRN